jgi:hypothetical protein
LAIAAWISGHPGRDIRSEAGAAVPPPSETLTGQRGFDPVWAGLFRCVFFAQDKALDVSKAPQRHLPVQRSALECLDCRRKRFLLERFYKVCFQVDDGSAKA